MLGRLSLGYVSLGGRPLFCFYASLCGSVLWAQIRINLRYLIPIRIQNADPDPGGTQKIEKSKEFLCFEVLDVLF